MSCKSRFCCLAGTPELIKATTEAVSLAVRRSDVACAPLLDGEAMRDPRRLTWREQSSGPLATVTGGRFPGGSLSVRRCDHGCPHACDDLVRLLPRGDVGKDRGENFSCQRDRPRREMRQLR